MEFFDKKEEVMEIQLTTYGRQLYSKGIMKPVYYAFFDDGILYDGAKGGLTEVQNDVQNRIKNETVFVKDVDDYDHADRFAKSPILVPNEFEKNVLPLMDFNSTFENQLGISKNNSDFAPAWSISFFNGEITGSNHFLTASADTRDIPIPQINVDQDSIRTDTRVNYDNVDQYNSLEPCELEENAFFNSGLFFDDGTTIEIKEGKILIKVEEKNTLTYRDGFEVEVFEVVELDETPVSTTKTSFLKPLKFFKEDAQIQDNLLVDGDTSVLENVSKINDTFVSFYLDISYDSDVDQDIVCEKDPNKKNIDIFFKNPISCDDEQVSEQAGSVYDPLGDGGIGSFIATLDEDC